MLRRHAPFGAMAQADLAFLAGRLKLRYFAEGAPILGPADGPVTCLFIVQRGRVRANRVDGVSYHAEAFTLTEGESFPVGALIGARPTTLAYSAAVDTFCYVLAAEDFHALMERSREFQDFCTRRLAHLLEESTRSVREAYSGRANAELGLASPLRLAIRRAPVMIGEAASIREALALMKARRVGSVVIADERKRPRGIFTQTDVLDRVALAGRGLDEPIGAVMTPRPLALPVTAPLADAANLMARAGVRHLLVMDGDELAGVISERDLFALQRRSMQGLRKAITHADSAATLAFVARDVRGLAGDLLAQGTAAEALMQLVTTLNDAIAVRAIELARERHDIGGPTLCWLGLGSEGRMEQTLATDQDNAIIFDDGGREAAGGRPEEIRSRLLPFAQEVNAILDECGFPLCKGGIMAANPLWCLSLDEWRARFDGWMRNSDPQALLNAAIFFDFRPLWGAEGLAEELRRFLLENVARAPRFLRQMTENALQTRPLGLLGDFVVSESGEQTVLDLKLHASRPFVDAARILALAAGVGATATIERLRQSAPRMRMGSGDTSAAIDAFLFVQMLRLRSDGNRVDPEALNPLDRRILKEALRQARKLQNRIALDYQL